MTDAPESPPAIPTDSPRAPRRWGRRLLAAGVIVTLLVVFHAPLLRLVAELLVVDDPLVETQAVVMAGVSGPYRTIPIDDAADLYQKQLVREVFLIEDRSSRIVQAGIVPTVESVLRKELAKRDIPIETLTVTSGTFRNATEVARPLLEWLEKHPDAHVTMLCGQFESRRSAHVMRGVLPPEIAGRIHWHALPDKRFDVTNWWQSRHGLVEVVGAYVSLLYVYAFGEPTDLPKRWDPDEYERELRQRNAAP